MPKVMRGFTLPELLISVFIISVLSALVVTAVRVDPEDRVSESSRTAQAFIEGAKSRAIAEGRTFGVQMIPAFYDERMVTGMHYVRVPDMETGSCRVRHDGNGWVLDGQWSRLIQRGLLHRGLRIQMPRDTGNWYNIALVNQVPSPNINTIRIQGHYLQSEYDDATGWWANPPSFDSAGNRIPPLVEFNLELAPALTGDSVEFSMATVIDLDSSQVPFNWHLPNVTRQILFDSRGQVVGAPGVISLYVTTTSDVELTRLRFVAHPAEMGGLSQPVVSADLGTVPETTPRVITVRPAGEISGNGSVDFTDSNGDGMADSPFRLSIRGT